MNSTNALGGFRFLEHMTDAEIEARGKNLEQAFENAALATEDTMVSLSSIEPNESKIIRVEGKDIQALLYSWLEALISLQDTDGMLFSKFSCRISHNASNVYELSATCLGEKFNLEKHEQKTAIKAPTYHDMKIFQEDGNVTLRFVLDL